MRTAAAAALAALAALAAAAAAAPADKYSARFDNVDVDAILHNDRLLDNYVKCLEAPDDKGCTPEGKALKGVLAEALHTDCAKCTDAQKAMVGKVVPHLRSNRPDAWRRLADKYDPEGEWLKKHPM